MAPQPAPSIAQMRMGKKPLGTTIARALLVMFLVAPLAHARGPADADWMNEEVVIRGDYFHAANVAYEDFSKQLARHLTDANQPNAAQSTRELETYLSTIDHYIIKVGMGRTRYAVWISPRSSPDFPVIFGGDALYVLDAATFKIVEKHFGK